ncbi:hypothetical protein [Methylovorus mays]|uniref:hypothetical protein n=1 Tax=Methylovorus mays TaxID=184077 RepID=UPI001E3B2A9C|nr:hypothetical protein [Methylovorus mays]MCB5206358.1 hypothetical protein [Methylovorus mays]
MNSYELVKIAKTKQGIESDRAFAINNGFTVQNISDWKAGRAIPNARNFLKLATCAEMSIDEALKFAEEMEAARFKQAGYSNLTMMGTLTGLSLLAVTHSPAIAGLIAVSGAATVYYVKSMKRRRKRQTMVYTMSPSHFQ